MYECAWAFFKSRVRHVREMRHSRKKTREASSLVRSKNSQRRCDMISIIIGYALSTGVVLALASVGACAVGGFVSALVSAYREDRRDAR